jgi:tripartite-type tricarboxylate transporter receptor subunit TctC
MNLPRRKFLHLSAAAAVFSAASHATWSQSYPTRPVRLVSGFPAGGPNDLIARLIGQWLSERLGQQFIIENRPGAGSNIAVEAVVKSPPDGHTLLVVSTPNAINATLYEKLSFNFIRDITPVGAVVLVPNVMVAHPSVPAETLPEFIAYAKGNPGKLTMASPGIGTSGHISGEMFKLMAGVDMIHVPYRGGGPLATDLIGGQVQVLFTPLPTMTEYIRAGTLRGLAVTSATRSAVLPNIPTVGEYVPGYEASTWFGVAAPKNTPTEIVDKLNMEINTGLADAKLKARLYELGGETTLPGSPADFGKLIAAETEKWGKVIRAANIKPE